MKASQKLIAWLDRGSVDKRSSSLFYSLIQSSNTHVRRLLLEKQQHEEEVNQAKLLFKQRVQGILVQCKLCPLHLSPCFTTVTIYYVFLIFMQNHKW